ncbi:MAG: tyrosine-type recombinase/integrase [Planctomycetes bacterium]|nr:tyrosine-type recombinase/integrase [Planctomycetota bacterium]
MGIVHKARLQYQPVNRRGLDRSVTFLTPDTPASGRRKIRGIIIEARDKAEARRKLKKLEAAAEEAVYADQVDQFQDELDRRHRPRPSTGPKFKQFALEEWLPNCVEGGGLRESQIESDNSILKNHLVPFFGEVGLQQIDGRMIDRFKATKRGQEHQYGKGYAAKTINNHISVLHRIMDKAEEYGLIDRNPVSKRAWLKPDTTPEDSENWWTPDDETRAFAMLDVWKETKPREQITITTQLITGLRFSEIRALEKRDLDLNVPGLWVRRSMARKQVGTPKNKRARFQVIPRALAQELREWMLRIEGQLLFPGVKGGHLANNTLNRWYRQLASEAGTRPLSSHGARHTSGSSYAFQGVGQKLIAKLLGHANTSSTERYTHAQVADTQPLVEARWARLTGGQDGDA